MKKSFSIYFKKWMIVVIKLFWYLISLDRFKRKIIVLFINTNIYNIPENTFFASVFKLIENFNVSLNVDIQFLSEGYIVF